VCDPGFSGHNCAIKECPRGDDPTTTGQQNELMKVACTADGGYWFFSFRGETSRAIPFNAGYGTVGCVLSHEHVHTFFCAYIEASFLCQTLDN